MQSINPKQYIELIELIHGFKDPKTLVQDLERAKTYIEWQLELIESANVHNIVVTNLAE
jgi:hypothetical protein